MSQQTVSACGRGSRWIVITESSGRRGTSSFAAELRFNYGWTTITSLTVVISTDWLAGQRGRVTIYGFRQRILQSVSWIPRLPVLLLMLLITSGWFWGVLGWVMVVWAAGSTVL